MISESLKALKDNFYASASEDIINTIEKSLSDLVENKLVDGALKVGDTLPAFELTNATGKKISSTSLLEKGPLVINFYRGGW